MLRLIKKGLQRCGKIRQDTSIKKEITRLNRKKEQLSNKWMNDLLGDQEYVSLIKEIDERVENLQHQLNQMEMNETEKTVEERLELIKSVLKNEILVKAKVKEVLSKVEKIVVFPNGDIVVHFQ